MGIAWRDAMTTGVAGLDADHKHLIGLINAVGDALGGKNSVTIGKALVELQKYVELHFAREEKVFVALNLPEIEAHRKLHRELTAKVQVLDAKFKAAESDVERQKVGMVLNNFLQEWLVSHILKEDLKIRPFVSERPRSEQPRAAPKPAQSWTDSPSNGGQEPEAPPPKIDRNHDLEYSLPPELQRLLKRIEYVIPDVPPPEGGFDSFEKLCEAAINRRIDKVLIFFQRYNPEVNRVLPPFFLASPEFAEKFHEVVVKFVFPTIWESRQIRVQSTNFDWANSDTESFWNHVDRPLQLVILAGWQAGWENLKLVSARKPDGTPVIQVKQSTKELREMLQPSTPEAYDLPKIGNLEIDTFMSLLDPAEDWWDLLNRAWQGCHDLYEQEMDPRVFQQKARDGALRDNLLAAFNRYPENWVDFLLLACHRVFPRITSRFLESFTRNLGRNAAERQAHMPYTMRYLRQVEARPDLVRIERDEELKWEEEMQTLRNFLKGRTAKE